MVSTTELKEIIIKNLKLEDMTAEEIDGNMALFGDDGLGLDSVDSIELVLAIDREFGVKIADSKEYETIFANVQSLADFINAQK